MENNKIIHVNINKLVDSLIIINTTDSDPEEIKKLVQEQLLKAIKESVSIEIK